MNADNRTGVMNNKCHPTLNLNSQLLRNTAIHYFCNIGPGSVFLNISLLSSQNNEKQIK
jgi:hypothetical protein